MNKGGKWRRKNKRGLQQAGNTREKGLAAVRGNLARRVGRGEGAGR